MIETRDIVCSNIRAKLREESVPYRDINYVSKGQIITEIRFEVEHKGISLFCVAQVTDNLLRFRHYLRNWQVRHEENFTHFCLTTPLELGYISYDFKSRAIYTEANILMFEDMYPSFEGTAAMMQLAREYLSGEFLLRCDAIGRKYINEQSLSIYNDGLIIQEDEVYFPGLMGIVLQNESPFLDAEMGYQSLGEEEISTCTICLGNFKGNPLWWSLTCERAQALLRAQGAQPFNTFFWKGTELYMRAQYIMPEKLIVSANNHFTLEVDRELGAVRLADGSEDDWIWLPLKFPDET